MSDQIQVVDQCLTKGQGRQLFEELLPMLEAGQPVLLDFSTRFFAPPFFNELFRLIFERPEAELLLKRINQRGISPTGRLILEQVLRSFALNIPPESYKVTVVNGKRVPVVHISNGIMKVINETGEHEWLMNTPIYENPDDYEDLLISNAATASEYAKRAYSNSNHSLRCTRCGKELSTITGYRKHSRSCLKKAV